MIKIKYKICNQNKGWGMICQGKEEKKIKKIRGRNCIIRNFQFRKFLPVKSNSESAYGIEDLGGILTNGTK